MDDLETMLAPKNLAYLGAKLEVPNFDAVPVETLRKNRQGLLKEVEVAKEFFKELAR